MFLALCATAASTPVFAQNSVTLYGMVDESIVYSNNQSGHANVYTRQGNLMASRFGLRGTEALSSTLSAIFDLQEGFDPDNGALGSSGLAFNRQAFFGLQDTRYGTVTAGRQYTSYYLLLCSLGPNNFLTGATGAHPGDIDGLDTTIRSNNSVMYTSPTLGGWQASAQYGFGGVAGSMESGSTISAALRYDGGPLSVAAGYLRMNSVSDTATTTQSASASYGTSAVNAGYTSARAVQHVAAVGVYRIGAVELGLNYSNVKYLPGGESLFTDTAVFNTYGALARYTFDSNVDVAAGYSYTRASKANGIDDSARYQQVSLKEAYHMSKRTTFYALQAYQHANGKTLGAAGVSDVIDANAVIGDSQNSTASSTGNQFVAMLGMAISF
ncbi:porin [Paraburkholderia sp.]|uniref:porin n=1 Tax=Paraburkholderia sp. TaxID=1926495 RepID=UPI0023A283B6|nr:porin [Paraburkholderia sp.]MDE1179805.1 porin [Paraburkholderia sp.]